MINIIAQETSAAVEVIEKKLNECIAEHSLFVSKNKHSLISFLQANAAPEDTLILVGDSDLKLILAEALGLSTYYDKNVQSNIERFCSATNTPMPSQYSLDKLCAFPEAFLTHSSKRTLQFACSGEVGRCKIFILPALSEECAVLFDSLIAPNSLKVSSECKRAIKVFGISEKDMYEKMAACCNPKYALFRCEEKDLDGKISLLFRPKCSASAISETMEAAKSAFAENFYSDKDETPAQMIVEILTMLHKTVATAESLTGGLVASRIVDVPGASAVLMEGLVTYSVEAKCKRLDINPHFVDNYGVVSTQVAHDMALALLKEGHDYAIATTGFAGPASADGLPVGLCFIAVGSQKGISVYRNVFAGNREQIRNQAANSALYYLVRKLI